MSNIGRNDICHCGSGKKYKHCHLKEDGVHKSKNRGILIGVILAVFILLSAMIISYEPNPAINSEAPGPAPAGKVWSPEHGHWHDE
ncbi:MAG: SEC-C metal-binding domain-containing protein [Candidatus Cyclobacteriaceae bacterium M2_1C_046]